MNTEIGELLVLVKKEDAWNQGLENDTVINDDIKVCMIMGHMVEEVIPVMEARENVNCVAHLNIELKLPTCQE